MLNQSAASVSFGNLQKKLVKLLESRKKRSMARLYRSNFRGRVPRDQKLLTHGSQAGVERGFDVNARNGVVTALGERRGVVDNVRRWPHQHRPQLHILRN